MLALSRPGDPQALTRGKEAWRGLSTAWQAPIGVYNVRKNIFKKRLTYSCLVLVLGY